METPGHERPDLIQQQVNELLGIRTFTRPPDGFDPVAASARELAAYGYPARPDASAHPRVRERWTRMLSHPVRMVVPKFAPMTDKGHGSRQRYSLPAGNGWGGVISFAAKGDSINFVTGQWTVPHVAAPTAGNCICATWIGIDGANDDPNGIDSGDILQAGTTQMIVVDDGWFSNSADYSSYAWCEWYPALPCEITNLHVSPGDGMFCSICATSPTEAIVHLLNVTTATAVAFIKTAPKDTRLVGNCAEWVVECPVESEMLLGRFGDVYFDSCLAGTQLGQVLLGGQGRLLPMYDTYGTDLAVASSQNEELVRVRYLGGTLKKSGHPGEP